MVKRRHIRGILEDAVHDRESYLDAVRGIPEYEATAEAELVKYREMITALNASSRLLMSAEQRSTFHQACIRATSWRESYLDSVGNSPDLIVRARREVKDVRAALEEYGGDPFERMLDRGTFVTLEEIQKKQIGTFIQETRVDGVITRTVSENGQYLGKVVVDVDGIIRAYLADGTISNEPFEEAFDAQQWLLDRMSKNLIMRSNPNDGGPNGPRF